jgi:inosose dehydratase
MVEPPNGDPDMPSLLAALGALDRDLFCIVEQDLYPTQPDVPLPIARRTRAYFAGCGLGAGRQLAVG